MSGTQQPDPVPGMPEKLDPETLVLRASPARAIRFKRGMVVGIAAFASVSLVGVAWMSLKPASFMAARQGEPRAEPAASSSDTVNALPSGYDQIPQLGPPLPGDLGRPILAHQREMATEMPGDGAVGGGQHVPAQPDNRLSDQKSARESGLMFGSRQPGDVGRDPDGESNRPAGQASIASTVALDPERDPNAQQRKADFAATANGKGAINPHALTPLISPYTLSAGSIISASLITGLRSDLPGIVTAQVTEQVYDSATGRYLLIPQGARLIGSYDSVVAFGQKRALLVWQRLILPDGSSLAIDNAPATDPSGYSGLADKVDFHTWTLLKGIALSTLLGVGSDLVFSGDSDLVQAIRLSSQSDVSRAGEQITSRNLNIQPTITIRPGAPARLMVHRDLILKPWNG
ncbi:TrbI/VirB10 family protein [Sphingobium boeckii]|uniref:Type IV secretion system protein VirB10 n=1 Tax=Sphingobium boeckii TaxID=1082345 RepID=A0A7W9AKR4_9SPHN|nr:TrbI/VirB10 family protein [Sphingobium boeckii]MBB5687488.1 type IV secretion system protein VirB10 [Sphingobium boeckii]